MSIIKYYNGERFFKLFYIYVIITYLTEVFINRSINFRCYQVSNIIGNIYTLIELLLLLALLLKFSNSNKRKQIIFYTFFASSWLIENIFIHKIYESERYFNVISSIIIFIVSIIALTSSLNKNHRSFFKEAEVIIVITILFNISFRIVFEFLYYNYEYSQPIIESINRIYIIVNFITNILFIYSLTCIKNTKKLISSF